MPAESRGSIGSVATCANTPPSTSAVATSCRTASASAPGSGTTATTMLLPSNWSGARYDLMWGLPGSAPIRTYGHGWCSASSSSDTPTAGSIERRPRRAAAAVSGLPAFMPGPDHMLQARQRTGRPPADHRCANPSSAALAAE